MKVIPIGHNWVRMLEYGILVNWLPKRKKNNIFLYKYLNEPESLITPRQLYTFDLLYIEQ